MPRSILRKPEAPLALPPFDATALTPTTLAGGILAAFIVTIVLLSTAL